MRFVQRLRASLVLLAAVLGLAAAGACGDSTGPKNVPIEETTFADTLHIDLSKFTRDVSGLYARDSVVGTGTTLALGQTVSIKYLGRFANGETFDQGTYTFKLGAGQAIPGWDLGIPGMKVGGSRRLIIPPELAYGATGYRAIPPYAVLVFDVTALSAQ